MNVKVSPQDLDLLLSSRWEQSSKGYAVRRHKCPGTGKVTKQQMSRVILGLSRGDGFEADHVNGNRLDNQRENLRRTTRQTNGQNIHVVKSRSGHRGVTWDAGYNRWKAQVGVKGRTIVVGWFHDIEQAAKAAADARKAHGFLDGGREDA